MKSLHVQRELSQGMNDIQATPEPLRLIRLPEVMSRTGLARPTIYRAVAKNQFPRPSKFGAATLWAANEVDAWIRERLAGRCEAAV